MRFNLADLFESVADVVPDSEALVCGEGRLTYRQLDERANRLAHHLEGAGIRPREHVGVLAYNASEYVECYLACFKVRAVPININYRYVSGELRYLFTDADLVGLVFHQTFGPRVAHVAADCPLLRHLVAVEDESGAELPSGAVDYEGALAASSPERGFPERSPDDLFIIYTGGTTGMPKGVMWRQEDLFFAGMGGGNPQAEPVERPEQVAENAAARGFQMTTFPVAPLMHGAAELATFITFHFGDRVVYVPRFDPSEVWRIVERERVNTISIVGDAMARPMAEALEAMDPRPDTSTLMVLSSAGAILSEAVKDKLQALIPNVAILDSFGASETGWQGMAMPGSSPDRGLRFQMNERTLVIGEDMRPVLPGQGRIGRVAQRGRVPVGYYNDPEKTKATFVEVEGERCVLPGDLARVEDDGTVTFLGRGSVCINTGGEKVYPEEVEAAVKSHPDVFDAVVVGVPDDRWGERVAALVQPRTGRAPSAPDVQEHCRTRIAGYKVPREIVFVEEIVRSPSGKPDYPWARGIAAARASAETA